MDSIRDLLAQRESEEAWNTAVDRLISHAQATMAVEMAQEWARSLNSSHDSSSTDRAKRAG